MFYNEYRGIEFRLHPIGEILLLSPWLYFLAYSYSNGERNIKYNDMTFQILLHTYSNGELINVQTIHPGPRDDLIK